MNSSTVITLAIYLLAVSLASIVMVFTLWPESAQLTAEHSQVRIFSRIIKVPREKHLLLLVLLMGLIGGCSYALWWFAHRVATGELQERHVVWYVLRPWISCFMTLIFYGLVRSGLFVTNLGNSKNINIYGMAGLAGAAGFLAAQVFEKLEGLLK